MTKLTSRRWAIIFFISFAFNLFLGGLFITDKYFNDQPGRGLRGMVYSVPWGRRILGDEVRPLARQVFRDYREKFRDSRRVRAELNKNVTAALAQEPFDKNALKSTLKAVRGNMQIGLTTMHSMMAEFSAQLTNDQRKKLIQEMTRIQEKRQRRWERRYKRRDEREPNG